MVKLLHWYLDICLNTSPGACPHIVIVSAYCMGTPGSIADWQHWGCYAGRCHWVDIKCSTEEQRLGHVAQA